MTQNICITVKNGVIDRDGDHQSYETLHNIASIGEPLRASFGAAAISSFSPRSGQLILEDLNSTVQEVVAILEAAGVKAEQYDILGFNYDDEEEDLGLENN